MLHGSRSSDKKIQCERACWVALQSVLMISPLHFFLSQSNFVKKYNIERENQKSIYNRRKSANLFSFNLEKGILKVNLVKKKSVRITLKNTTIEIIPFEKRIWFNFEKLMTKINETGKFYEKFEILIFLLKAIIYNLSAVSYWARVLNSNSHN